MPYLRPLYVWLSLLLVSPMLFADTFRPMTPVTFPEGTPVLDQARTTIRETFPGEVMMVERDEGDLLRLRSVLAQLPGGFVEKRLATVTDVADLRRWQTEGRNVSATLETRAAEQRQSMAADVRARAVAHDARQSGHVGNFGPWANRSLRTVIRDDELTIGYFNLGRNTTVVSHAVHPHGHLFLTGTVFGFDHDRWGSYLRPIGGMSVNTEQMGPQHQIPYIAHIAPDLSRLIAIYPLDYDTFGGIRRVHVDGKGYLYLALENFSGRDPTEEQVAFRGEGDVLSLRAGNAVLRFSPNLQELEWVTWIPGLPPHWAGMVADDKGRVVIWADEGTRDRGNHPRLARLHSNGIGEAGWPERNETRIRFDLRRDEWTGDDAPFSVWNGRSTVWPNTATPIGPFGSRPNAGQPIEWKGSAGQLARGNPYVLWNLMAEHMNITKQGNIILGGTVPHHMPLPGFDPFVALYSPEGEMLWGNILLDGFLSEPDQKCQGIAIDPTNGDILISYRQHGNNIHSMILDPNGIFPRWTGAQGNIMITWLGRIDAVSGQLKNSTYMYSRMPASYQSGWPDLSNYFMHGGISVDHQGYVYVGGMARNVSPTTRNAYLPQSERDTFLPVIHVLTPDLSAMSYGTYLAEETGQINFIQPYPDNTIVAIGHMRSEQSLRPDISPRVSFLSSERPEIERVAPFIALLKPPKGRQQHQWRFGPSPFAEAELAAQRRR